MSSDDQFPRPFSHPQSDLSHHHLGNWISGCSSGVGSSFPPSPLELVAAMPQMYHGPSSRSPRTFIPDSQRSISQVVKLIEGSGRIGRPPMYYGGPLPSHPASPRPSLEATQSIGTSVKYERPLMYSQPSLPSSSNHILDVRRPSTVAQPIQPKGKVEIVEEVLRRSGEDGKAEKHILPEKKVVPCERKKLRSTSGSSRRTAFADPLRRETVFVYKMKFSNELPDLTDQPKVLKSFRRSYDGLTQYQKSSLEQHHRPEIYAEPDLGIPLDLLDQSALNPRKGVRLSLAPEDEELLRDDDVEIEIEKHGLKKRQHPDVESISWLLKSPHRPSHLRKPLDILDSTALNRANDLRLTLDREDKKLLGDHNLLYRVEKNGLNKKVHPKAGLIARVLKSHHHSCVTRDARNKRYRSAARRKALAVIRRRKRVANCAPQSRVIQDCSLNHLSNVEHNSTRPKRDRKKPAYLADYELYY